MSSIGVSYTPSGGSPVYNFVLSDFTDTTLPRSYSNVAAFSQSASGTLIIDGPAYEQKRIWAVSTIMTNAEAVSFDAMFKAWDADRASGLSAAVGIIDETFGPQINTSAVFSTAPTFGMFGNDMTKVVVSFGLSEI